MSSIERQQRKTAEHAAESRQFIQEVSNKVTEHLQAFNELKGQVETVASHFYQAAGNIEQKYVTFEHLKPQMQEFSTELQTMISVVADLNARYVELSS